MGAVGARQLAATLNAAPRGGSLSYGREDCTRIGAPSYVLTFGYDSHPTTTVWVRIDGCGVLGASNGSVVHQRTFRMIEGVSAASGLRGIGWSGLVLAAGRNATKPRRTVV